MTQPNSHFFPVECSILSASALQEQILPCYSLKQVTDCFLLQHGDNDTYIVYQGATKYILRVWSKDERTHAEIEAEVELLDYLAQNDVPVAKPLKRVDGRYLTEVNAPEGMRFVGIFHYAEGVIPGWQITPEQSFCYGQGVAKMHCTFDELTSPYLRPQWNLAKLLVGPLDTIHPMLIHRPSDQRYLVDLVEILSEKLADMPQTQPVFGLCHGDLHKANLLWTDDQQLTLLDFDLCGYGWRAYDLAILFWSTCHLKQAKAVREAYISGYGEVRPLESIELQTLPYFVAVRDIYIMQTRVGHMRRGVVDSQRVDQKFFDERFDFLRRWMKAVQDDSYYGL
ncbi:MAG: phosphotransferase [Chloroflexota bacterium]